MGHYYRWGWGRPELWWTEALRFPLRDSNRRWKGSGGGLAGGESRWTPNFCTSTVPAGFLEQRCLQGAGWGDRPCERMSVPTPHCTDGETEATWRRAAATRGPASQSCPGCHPEPAPLLTSYSDILRVLDLYPHLPLFLLEWGPGDSSAEVQPARLHLCALLVKPVSACLLQCSVRVTMAHSCKQLNYQVTNPSQCSSPCGVRAVPLDCGTQGPLLPVSTLVSPSSSVR